MKRQVEKTHYNFKKYVPKERWISYWHQINEVEKLNVKEILIIGKGDGIVSDIFIKIGYAVTTFDMDAELNPDIIGSIEELGVIIKKKFDVILCCQVLEHLPFNSFAHIIQDLKKVTKKYLIISLPYESITFGMKILIPKLKLPLLLMNISKLYKNWKWDGQHYWEVGVRGKSVRTIKNILKKYFIVKKRYIVEENPYHMFFILETGD